VSKHLVGLLIGGVLPIIFYGVGGVLQKTSTQNGIGTALYILCSAIGALIAGIIIYAVIPDKTISFKSGGYAFTIGILWAFGLSAVAIALFKYNVPLSKLAPIYNMNTLLTVVLGLIVYSEWKEVNVIKLLIGAVLVMVGGVLVANS
jgi:drug/metabolite transporter (DMT)-like permease